MSRTYKITDEISIHIDELDQVLDDLHDAPFEVICTDHPIMKSDQHALKSEDLSLWLGYFRALLLDRLDLEERNRRRHE